MNFKFLWVVFALVFFCLSAASEPAYRFGAGDRVKVIVYGHQDLSGEFEVDGGGQISLPLVKIVRAAGLTKPELEQAITNKLKPDYLVNPKVNVEILTYRPVYIMGEVRKPGSYPYVTGMTVVNAVALAGGFTYRAKAKKILIIRSNEQGKQKIKAGTNTKVLPGDIIEVPERFF